MKKQLNFTSLAIILSLTIFNFLNSFAQDSVVKKIPDDVLSYFPSELKSKPMRSASAKKLADGVMYLSAHFDNLFGDGPVDTHWLLIDWKKANESDFGLRKYKGSGN